VERIGHGLVPYELIHTQEGQMKKISYVLAALATIAIAVPAVAQDKPMMKEGMGEKPMVHEHMHHHMHVTHVHHHYHHHMSVVKKPMTDKM
jgi:hypothetical protein